MEFNTFDSKPLRILIDTRMLLGSFSGVARVVTGLIHELTLLDNVQVIALCGNESYEPFEKNKNIEVVTTSFSREMRTAARRVWWEESQLPGILREVQPHVYHATWNTGIPKRCSVPAILTIHDLIPSQNPRIHFYTRTQQWAHEYSLSASAKRASAITTVSNYSRKEVLDYLHIDPQRVFTVWNGVEQSPATETETPSFDQPFVLYVGGHQSRKNTAGLLRTMQTYWKHYDSTLQLRLTGSEDSLGSTARAVYNELPDKSRIVFLGKLDDASLNAHYSAAQALVFLSYEEGFGLPALEAMASGCPVVSSNRTSLPEVVGKAGLLVDPDDHLEAASAIHRLLTDSKLRQQLMKAGKHRAEKFSWRRTAQRYHSIYTAIANGLDPATQISVTENTQTARSRSSKRPKEMVLQPT